MENNLNDVYSIIANSSMSLLGFLIAFVVFRFGFLRREIDDYRGRVIFLIPRLIRKIYPLKYITTNKNKLNFAGMPENFYNMSDKELSDYIIKEIISSSNYHCLSKEKYIFSSSPIEKITFEFSYKIFNKRFIKRQKILKFFCFCLCFLSVTFIFSLLSIYGWENIKNIISLILHFFDDPKIITFIFTLLFVVLIIYIFKKIYNHLSDDY